MDLRLTSYDSYDINLIMLYIFKPRVMGYLANFYEPTVIYGPDLAESYDINLIVLDTFKPRVMGYLATPETAGMA